MREQLEDENTEIADSIAQYDNSICSYPLQLIFLNRLKINNSHSTTRMFLVK